MNVKNEYEHFVAKHNEVVNTGAYRLRGVAEENKGMYMLCAGRASHNLENYFYSKGAR